MTNPRSQVLSVIPMVVAALAVALAVSCTPAAADDRPHRPGGRGDAGSAPTGTPPSGAAPANTKAAVLARLARLNQSDQFLFGQQNALLWGMFLGGKRVSTNAWFEATARAGHFTSDSYAAVGDHPAVMGVSMEMLAFEPPDWNRRAATAEAIRRQLAAGGLVTMEWHAPSCNADLHSPGPLATVKVGGREVTLPSVPGGTLFYADEEYRHAIASRADVPDALKCLCQIANDLPLTAGPYKGPGQNHEMTGKTWLIAHAKQAAAVLREQGLAGSPIIVRPFHEQTGSWFWWGQPYWNCAALLGRPGAVSGADAYKETVRTFTQALRSEPGMDNLVFAYSPDKLLGAREEETFTAAENKVTDPSGHARDILRVRLVRELTAAGLAHVSPAQRALKLRASQATSASAKTVDAYVAERRPYYAEAYAGDDVFDVLGVDLYHPIARPANAADLRLFEWQLRVLADEARARGKAYALTEAGTYRLELEALAARAAPGQPVVVNGKAMVDDALGRLFDPADRAQLLKFYGLRAAGPVSLTAAERRAVVPRPSEDWFNQQLLKLARNAKVAYALVWQTYADVSWTDRYFYYYIPYPGHPDTDSFRRFYNDPATCFLRDNCGR